MLEAIQGYRAPERMSIEELNASGPFPAGAPNTAYARYFTGKSYLTAISTSQVPLFAVSFEPGCRNSWHVHRASRGGGQILVATAGRGYCQIWGEEPVELHPGDVVHIPANVRHWHGARHGLPASCAGSAGRGRGQDAAGACLRCRLRKACLGRSFSRRRNRPRPRRARAGTASAPFRAAPGPSGQSAPVRRES